MTSDFKITETPRKPLSMHPKKFAMWLFLITVSMLFAAFTSAYIVRMGEGNWLIFDLPTELYFTTAILLISSFTIQFAHNSAQKDNLKGIKAGLNATMALAVIFLIGQLLAWNTLVENNVYFVGNPAGSFVYVLTGVHAAHIIGGFVFLILTSISAYKYRVHSKNMLRISLCTTYWHFMDGLWIYLFLFLLFNN